ncbi:hypothetical protein BCR43DRAFT_481978 [Syncephalastrum racemosum]|uniref:Uncharacterized protein n=1 Tax=Syncephalastrum racemosum TaxID=13706 RepID=A0A1X2HSZ3_SYNRA|nr:hypothetical protein BCR43DRAFT_481978 [Syncephalastrum racemosum]
MQCIRAVGRVYNRNYESRPMLTLCVTNACLGAISDGLAQAIGFYDYHRNHPKDHPYSAALEGTLPEHVRQHESLWAPPPRFDPWRTVRFALYNFSVAPIVGKWYILLDRFFPMPKTIVSSAAKRLADKITIKRMAVDQLVFAPSSLVVFFTTMGFIESRSWEGVREKFRDAYTPALIANYKVWPVVQFINFKFMPLPYRLPFVSSLGILWNAYLSWINNAAKQEKLVHDRLDHTMQDSEET